MDKQLEKLDKEILEWKLRLKKCTSVKSYRDTRRHYERLCDERARYKKYRGYK